MSDLEKFIEESNKIEGELTILSRELPIYEWWLAQELTESMLMQLHYKLCTARKQVEPRYRGVYRNCPVWIAGEERGHYNIEGMMKDLFDEMPEPFEFHKRYEHIHPFVDLNGRTGRAIWLHQMLEKQDVPLGFLHTWYYQSLS